MGTNQSGPQNVFCVSREIFKHPYVGAGNAGREPWHRMEAWLWLVGKANFRPSEIDVRGQTIHLTRGQMVISLERLAERWGWTVKQVRGFLDRIQELSMIGRETGTPKGSHQTLLTISNYEIYQFLEDYLGQPKRQPKGNPRAAQGQQSNKNNKENTNYTHTERDFFGQELEAFNRWNAMASRCGVHRAQDLTADRRRLIRAILTRYGGLDGWDKALRNIEASTFLCGQGQKRWRIDLKFFLKPENFLKVKEGGYGNGLPASASNEPAAVPEYVLNYRPAREKAHPTLVSS